MPYKKIERVKVGEKPKMVEEDVFEDRKIFKEVVHTASYDLTGGDQAKATQVSTEVVNLRNEVETKHITFTDNNGNEELVTVPDDAKGILDLTKAVRRNEAAIKGADGYMKGQANLTDKGKK